MANPTQATQAQVYGATPIRLAELGAEWLRLDAEGVDTTAVEAALFDLLAGTEHVAGAATEAGRAATLGYLIETYGLLAVATDPLLRPLLPAIPATGATVVRRPITSQGRRMGGNGSNMVHGATLVPNPPI